MKSQFIKPERIDPLRAQIGFKQFLPFDVALQTGMRIGDVVALERKSLSRVAGKCFVDFTAQKTKKSAHVEITEELYLNLLRNAGKRWLFTSPIHPRRHITRQACWERVKKASKALGYTEQYSPHSFRKNFAVELLHEKDLGAVQAALQHTNKDVTALYAYADGLFGGDPDAPLTRRDLPMIVDFILAKLHN